MNTISDVFIVVAQLLESLFVSRPTDTLHRMMSWHSFSFAFCTLCYLGGVFLVCFVCIKHNHHDYEKSKSEFSALSFTTVKCGQYCMQMNGRKLVMCLETDVLLNYHWHHSVSPTPAWKLSKLICSNNWLQFSNPNIRKTERERERGGRGRERDCLKL